PRATLFPYTTLFRSVVRHADESVAPGAGRPGTMAFAALRDIVLVAAAEIPANLESTIEPRPDRMIVVLEREHDDRLLSVAEAVGMGLARVQQPHVGRIERRLADHADRLGSLEDVVEQDGRAAAVGRAVLQAHP